MVFIKSIQLNNFLSYGNTEPLELKSLNVLIGPNGSGKSNLLDAIDLMRHCPEDVSKPIRAGGGVLDWIRKSEGAPVPEASLNAVISYQQPDQNLRYVLKFTASGTRFEISDEKIERESCDFGHNEPYFYYKFNRGKPILNIKSNQRKLQTEECDLDLSILAQRRDPENYPEITYLAQLFGKFKLYREWSFGRFANTRVPQSVDQPTDFIEPDGRNLGVVLNHLRTMPMTKKRILSALQELYSGIEDYDMQLAGSSAQVFLQEENRKISATRLSDGTLRYLTLLAILCHPTPPPLICLEEPELGLHPDIMPFIAQLLLEASERTQLIVTTHSEVLVDALTDNPDSIVVTEKNEQGTYLKRLDSEKLKPWLEKYRLGQLWTRGDIGGTRW